MQKVVTRQKTGSGALLFHGIMIVCTAGLWTPIFLAARRKRASVTYIQAPIPVAPQPYPAPPQQPYGQPQPYSGHAQYGQPQPYAPPAPPASGKQWQPPAGWGQQQ